MRVLVTGASGFVGSTLCGTLARAGYRVRAALRTDRPMAGRVDEHTLVGEIVATTDWSRALEAVDFVVHAAARVHVLRDTSGNDDAYVETNSRGTLRVAAASAQAGVRRFIYLSSVKVNGEETAERACLATDEPRPSDGQDISTAYLIRRIAHAMQRRARLLPVPVSCLYAVGGIARRRAEIARLCGSLVVDIAPTCTALGWVPPVGVDPALARTFAWQLTSGRSRGT